MLEFDYWGFFFEIWNNIKDFGVYLLKLLNTEVNLYVNFVKIGNLEIGTKAFFDLTHLPSKFTFLSILGVGLVGFMSIRLIKKFVPLA